MDRGARLDRPQLTADEPRTAVDHLNRGVRLLLRADEPDLATLLLALDELVVARRDPSLAPAATFDIALLLDRVGVHRWAAELWERASHDPDPGWGREAVSRRRESLRRAPALEPVRDRWEESLSALERCLAPESADEEAGESGVAGVRALCGEMRGAREAEFLRLIRGFSAGDHAEVLSFVPPPDGPSATSRFVGLLQALVRYQSHSTDTYRAVEQELLEIAEEAPFEAARLKALRVVGLCQAITGRLDVAVDTWSGALTEAEAGAWDADTAGLQVLIAEAAAALGDPPALELHLPRALTATEGLEPSQPAYLALEVAGRTAENLGVPHAAWFIQSRAVDVAAATGSPRLLAAATSRLDWLEAELGLPRSRPELARRAAREIEGEAGALLLAESQLASARRKLECCALESSREAGAAREVFEKRGQRLLEVDALRLEAAAVAGLGRGGEAIDLLERAARTVEAAVHLSPDGDNRRTLLDRRRGVYDDLVDLVFPRAPLRALDWARRSRSREARAEPEWRRQDPLVSYFVTERGIYRWSERAGAPVDAALLSERPERVVRRVRSLREAALQGSADEVRELGAELGAALLSGVSAPRGRLYVHADSFLHHLPFDLLVPASGPGVSESPYEVVLLHGARTPTRDRRGPALVVSAASQTLGPLREAETEARTVAGLVPEPTLLLGEQATIAQVLDRAAGARILHFAVHAEDTPNRTWDSALHLADGLLRASVVRELELDGALVFLSACSTRQGVLSPSLGTLSLANAFHEAGAETVVSTLWEVDDLLARTVASDFYSQLAKGVDPLTALSASKRRVFTTWGPRVSAFQVSTGEEER